MLQVEILVTRCKNPNSVHRLQSLSSTRFVFRLPALQINHGVNNDRSTVLLSSYNEPNNTTKQNKHTRWDTRDPRRRQTSHDWSQRENQGQLFQLIRIFVKKVGVWKGSANEPVSLMQLISNSKLLQSNVHSRCKNEFSMSWMKILHI